MGLFSSFSKSETTNWLLLTSIDQLAEIKKESHNGPVLILKHSTSCSISRMAKNRLDSNWESLAENAKMYYLDLLKFREISNQIQIDFKIRHESPQILVIKNGVCTYAATHGNIDPNLIKKEL